MMFNINENNITVRALPHEVADVEWALDIKFIMHSMTSQK